MFVLSYCMICNSDGLPSSSFMWCGCHGTKWYETNSWEMLGCDPHRPCTLWQTHSCSVGDLQRGEHPAIASRVSETKTAELSVKWKLL